MEDEKGGSLLARQLFSLFFSFAKKQRIASHGIAAGQTFPLFSFTNKETERKDKGKAFLLANNHE
jgi:hypothetical protein